MGKYRFAALDEFRRDYKEAQKKNSSLDAEFEEFLNGFDHSQGVVVPGTGGAQKIRLKRANVGKSGGYRIYYFFRQEEKVFLLRFYAKSEKEDLSLKEKIKIRQIIQAIRETT